MKFLARRKRRFSIKSLLGGLGSQQPFGVSSLQPNIIVLQNYGYCFMHFPRFFFYLLMPFMVYIVLVSLDFAEVVHS